MIKSDILKMIMKRDIKFAIIKGKYDIESSDLEDRARPDLDIVIKSESAGVIYDIRNNKDFHSIEQFSFLEKKTNIRVDLYFDSLNVGYYHFLNIENNSFFNKRVSEEEYIIYQLIDPLLKFSCYLPRHQYRLKKYFSDGIPDNITHKLEKIIGYNLTEKLLNKILIGNFDISQFFIKKCKINILFINGNFVKMIKQRIFI